jgi:hypothetical protein
VFALTLEEGTADVDVGSGLGAIGRGGAAAEVVVVEDDDCCDCVVVDVAGALLLSE